MKVYLISGDEYEQRYICGAFTSKELAEARVRKLNEEKKQGSTMDNFYAIAEEVELDG